MNEIPQCSDINRQRVNRLHLRTERLIVQKFSKRDVEHNVRHELDRQLMKYIREPWSLDKTRSRTQHLAADWFDRKGIMREADKMEGQWHNLAIFGQLESENGLRVLSRPGSAFVGSLTAASGFYLPGRRLSVHTAGRRLETVTRTSKCTCRLNAAYCPGECA